MPTALPTATPVATLAGFALALGHGPLFGRAWRKPCGLRRIKSGAITARPVHGAT